MSDLVPIIVLVLASVMPTRASASLYLKPDPNQVALNVPRGQATPEFIYPFAYDLARRWLKAKFAASPRHFRILSLNVTSESRRRGGHRKYSLHGWIRDFDAASKKTVNLPVKVIVKGTLDGSRRMLVNPEVHATRFVTDEEEFDFDF